MIRIERGWKAGKNGRTSWAWALGEPDRTDFDDHMERNYLLWIIGMSRWSGARSKQDYFEVNRSVSIFLYESGRGTHAHSVEAKGRCPTRLKMRT